MSDLAIEIYTVTPLELLNVTIGYMGKLSKGELLTGTPIVKEEITNDLVITNESINTAKYYFKDGRVAEIGQAVQFSFSGQKAGTNYNIDTLANTTATPSQRRNVEVRVRCKAT